MHDGIEDCDDGNTVSGDGCPADCQIECPCDTALATLGWDTQLIRPIATVEACNIDVFLENRGTIITPYITLYLDNGDFTGERQCRVTEEVAETGENVRLATEPLTEAEALACAQRFTDPQAASCPLVTP